MINILSLTHQYLKTKMSNLISLVRPYFETEEQPSLNGSAQTQDALESKKMYSLIRDYLATQNVSSLNELFRTAQITTVNLSFRRINAQQAKTLGLALQGTQVHTVKVAGNNLGAQGVKDLVDALQGTQVRDLDVSNNNIGSQGAKDIGIALQGTQVRILNIASNSLGIQGAKDLGLTLKNTQVNVLDVGYNSLHYCGAIVLVLALRNTQVHTLRLYGNCLGHMFTGELPSMQFRSINRGSGGAKLLGEALQGTLVHTLDVSKNSIDNLQSLAHYLKNTHVHTFDVSHNNDDDRKKHLKDLENKKAKDLAEALKGSNVTRVIGINSIELTKVCQKNLEDKKDRVTILAEIIDQTILAEETGSHILSYTHEAYASDQSKTTPLTFKEGGSGAHTLFGNVLERLSNKQDLTATHALQP